MLTDFSLSSFPFPFFWSSLLNSNKKRYLCFNWLITTNISQAPATSVFACLLKLKIALTLLWLKWHLCNMFWICLFHWIFFLTQFRLWCQPVAKQFYSKQSVCRAMTYLEIIHISSPLPSTLLVMLNFITMPTRVGRLAL